MTQPPAAEELTRNQAFYRENREREQARARQWYAENKDKIDREKKREYLRAYFRTHPRPKLTPEERAKRNAARRERYATDQEFREHLKAKAKRWHTPESKRAGHLKAYGLTHEAYAAMLASQGGGCAICGSMTSGSTLRNRERNLPIDHDHQTGLVRGILCQRCNIGIGQFLNDPALLLRAAQYLTKSSSGVSSMLSSEQLSAV